MSSEFHHRVQRLLEEVVQREPDQRELCIWRECAGSRTLMSEVLSLLPHYEAVRDLKQNGSAGLAWKLLDDAYGAATCSRTVDSGFTGAEEEPPFCIDQYKILKVLGRGGMGVVYRAEHSTLRHPFALKVLRTGFCTQEHRRRFDYEVEIHRQLLRPGHPGVVRLAHHSIAGVDHANTIGTHVHKQPYFVMECVDGMSLGKYIEECKPCIQRRLELFGDLCDAVEYLHHRGIVHRDLKPDNILVDESGQPKIFDFGIARIGSVQSSLFNNENGRFIGTQEYASPEQAAGRVKRLTPGSDVYSLGLICHELLTGTLPPRVNGEAQLNLDGVYPPDDWDRLSWTGGEFRYYLSAILTAALRTDERARMKTAGDLGEAIKILSPTAPPSSRWPSLANLLSCRSSSRSKRGRGNATNAALSAVLRTRVERAMEYRH